MGRNASMIILLRGIHVNSKEELIDKILCIASAVVPPCFFYPSFKSIAEQMWEEIKE